MKKVNNKYGALFSVLIILILSLPMGIAPTEELFNVQCSDEIDNDLDGLVDYPDDPGCVSPYGQFEEAKYPTYLDICVLDNEFACGSRTECYSPNADRVWESTGVCLAPCGIDDSSDIDDQFCQDQFGDEFVCADPGYCVRSDSCFDEDRGAEVLVASIFIGEIDGEVQIVSDHCTDDGTAIVEYSCLDGEVEVACDLGCAVDICSSNEFDPVDCQRDDDCLDTEYCAIGECVETSCSLDDDCDDGFVCNAESVCERIECSLDSDCDANFVCTNGLCEEIFRCSSSDECLDGEVCDGSLCLAYCAEGDAGCSDGVDNDGDGLVDFPEDPECRSPLDNWEERNPQCADNIDNDGNGLCDVDGCCDGADFETETLCNDNGGTWLAADTEVCFDTVSLELPDEPVQAAGISDTASQQAQAGQGAGAQVLFGAPETQGSLWDRIVNYFVFWK